MGTRSVHERSVKVVNPQVSSTYGSTELISNCNWSTWSNLSHTMSRRSNDDDYLCRNDDRSKKSCDYLSIRRPKRDTFLFNKIEIKNLKGKVLPP